MYEAVVSKFAKRPRHRPHLPSLVGTGWVERMRSTSFALLGLTAAAGLAMVAVVSQLGFPLLAPAPLPSSPEQGSSVAKAISLGQGGALAPTAIDGRPTATVVTPSAGGKGSGDRRQAAVSQPTEVGSPPQQGAGGEPAAGEPPSEESAPAPEPSASPEPAPEPVPVKTAPDKERGKSATAPDHAVTSDLPGAVKKSLDSPGKSRGSSGKSKGSGGHGSGGKRSSPALPPLPTPSGSSGSGSLPEAVPDEAKDKGKGKKDK